ncbi:RNA-binding protein [Marichromatium bheemlicum]|uniref:RNA-binding protein n=1 Tax=Marichromatium bheemlicum TaxID=365339 RepID=A0ABX1I7N0_9GAMM|nr:RNA-binding protein [Marichromatium bheemlicum]NKN32756.1 RNA-binding protein [Marichromatium bheemlicum]
MEVFIGNLPGSATLEALRACIGGVGLRADLHRYDGEDRWRRGYHFFVARTASRVEGEALIARLRGLRLEGQALVVREYRPRATTPDAAWGGAERRINPW